MRFRNEYDFLSNFYPSRLVLSWPDGTRLEFGNVEAAFQAMKCPERAHEFCNLDGAAAKHLGRHVALRPDWDEFKLPLMRNLIRGKFSDPELKIRLLAIPDDIPIVEDNAWGDRYWGRCDNIGQNRLGEILEDVRRELRDDAAQNN